MVYNSVTAETCQICICEMTQADEHFPLHCPTRKCNFNVCLDCIIGMVLSEADGYQLASDGSHQLKFRVRCPNCCVKYTLPSHPKQSIVPYVATLRQAYLVRKMLTKPDNTLRQEEYNRKRLFMKFTALKDVQEALDIYEAYCEMTGKLFSGRLDMADFLVLPRLKVPWADPTLFSNEEEKFLSQSEQQFITQLICSGDPDSVVQGVVSLRSMAGRHHERRSPLPEGREDSSRDDDSDGIIHSIEPHDFIAQIFCGASPTLTSSCTSTSCAENEEEFDNNSLIDATVGSSARMGTQRALAEPIPEFDPNRTLSNEELMQRMFGLPPAGPGREPTKGLTRAVCSFRSFRQRTSSRIRGVPLKEPVMPEVQNLPLPNRMPLAVEVPTFNPTGWYKPIKLCKHKETKLVLSSFRGVAKFAGLKAGDVLTHVQCEPVRSVEQYHAKMLKLYKEDPHGQCSLVVNADLEVAEHLKTRSLLMRLVLRR